MKSTSFLHKIIVTLNILAVLLLITAFLGTHINPKYIKYISLVSLSTPFLLILNGLFVLFWILRGSRSFLLSTITLVIGYSSLALLYQYSAKEVIKSSDTKLMSYNVRLFNQQNWIKEEKIPEKMSAFFKKTNPDILCLQEYVSNKKMAFSYPYTSIKLRSNSQLGIAIFSKYPIIKSGSLRFPNTSNDAMYADIVKNKDTFRIYNIHLQSLKINPKKELDTEHTKNIIKRIDAGFQKQVAQAVMIKEHEKNSPYRTVICGDFNNTAFSWVYQQLQKDKKDAFKVAGKGFGKTYDYSFPFRIDFILADKSLDINYFKTYTEKYSDHYPIMTRIEL